MTRDLRLPLAFVAVLLLVASLDAAAQSLTAGDVDDHLNWDHYLDYLDRFGQEQSNLPALGFAERATLLIEDRDGDPLGGVKVTVGTQTGNVSLRSGMGGVVRVMPVADGLGSAGEAMITVETRDGNRSAFHRDLSDAGPHRLVVDSDARAATALDLMFVIDTTGSMTDELAYLTNEFENIVAGIETAHANVDINFGLVVYRDHGDDYVVRNLGFTGDLQTMQSRLAQQSAQGGGDYPEAMDEALRAAVDDQWRADAVRLLFLVADAPPHQAGYSPMLDAAHDARHAGIHLHPLAASGVADEAEYLMRAAAALTQGRYMFLTDDSGIGDPHAEPSIPCYVVTSLDDLVVRIVASDLTGTRVEPDPQDVLRESGRYEQGVCLADAAPQEVAGNDGGGDDGSGEASGATAPADTVSSDDGGDSGTRVPTEPRTIGDSSDGTTGGDEPTTGSGAGEPSAEATPGPAAGGAILVIGLAAAWVRRRP